MPVPRLVGHSPCIEKLWSRITALSGRGSTVLIRGESGVGKELVAQQIHKTSPRGSGPFVAVDCSTLRDTLFESQLFGHVRGAFTGAQEPTLGFWRAADGGTLFLDEIGELPLPMQAKLLRCIQDRAVIPVGSVEPIPVDVRLIAATHRNLEEMVRSGEFRQDLYYRLKVVRIDVPPLRDHMDDVAVLAEHFLIQLSQTYQEPPKSLSPSALNAFEAYHWPGNVRELANAIEYAYVLSSSEVLTVADLPDEVRAAGAQQQIRDDDQIIPLDVAERSLIMRALIATKGNQARAARLLKIERRRLYRKIRQYGLATYTVRKLPPGEQAG